MVKKILLPLLVLAVGATGAYLLIRTRPAVERHETEIPPPLVTVTTVERGPVALDVASQGTAEPHTESTLVAQVAGRILEVSEDFAEGAFVDRGQWLVRIDPADYRLAVEQARSGVAAGRVRLELEEAEARVAREEWRELGRGEPSPLALRQPQVDDARAALASAEARLAQARLNLERTTVRAPFTGRLSAKQADVGQFVNPGTPLATVFATDWAQVRLPVPKDQLGFLELDLGEADLDGAGPAVELTAELGGEARRWRGRVVRTAGAIDPRTRMLDLFARVEDPYARRGGGASTPLPMGLFLEATIAGRTVPDAVVAPRSALTADDRLMVVETVDGEDRLRFVEVEILRRQGDTVVLGRGVEDGVRLPTSPLETPVDGMRLRTTAPDAPDATDARPAL